MSYDGQKISQNDRSIEAHSLIIIISYYRTSRLESVGLH
jgi:hypothetical protein